MSARRSKMVANTAPVLVALAYFVIAAGSLALTKGEDGIATVWPSSGVLLAALMRTPPKRWRLQIALAALASFGANWVSGNGFAPSAWFTVANMAESILAVALMRRWCGCIPSFVTLADVLRFSACCVVGAACSASIAWTAAGGGASMATSWFATDLLGMLIVAPLALTVVARPMASADRRTLRTVADMIVSLCLLTALTAGVFIQSSYPLLFVPLVGLLSVTYRLGPSGAAAGVLLIAAIGSALTAAGHGPLVLLHGHDPVRAALFLQFYILTLFASALPLAALLEARSALTARLEDRERSYRLLADNSRDMIVRIGLDGVRRYVSPSCREILGYEPHQLVGVTPAGAIHPDDRVRAMETCRRLISEGGAPICTYRQARSDGTYIWLEAVYTLVRDPSSGAPVEFIASVRDISKRQAAELEAAQAAARLLEGNRLLSMAERMAHVGHWRLDAINRSVLWSEGVFRIHGVEGRQTPTLADAIDVYVPEDRARIAAIVQAAVDTGDDFGTEGRIVRPDGAVRHVLLQGEVERAPDGTVLAVIGVIQDVTQHREAESLLDAARTMAENAMEQALTMAATDDLTGLSNRRHTLHALETAVGQARLSGSGLSVAMFDIDHFKSVNDRFGHGVGDDVLRRVAKSARDLVRPSDLVGRIGGEEFVMILPGADEATATRVAERLRQGIAAASASEGPAVTVSVGIATIRQAATGAALLQRADEALYAAKNAGRNTLRLAV